jgi:hypothetical protein
VGISNRHDIHALADAVRIPGFSKVPAELAGVSAEGEEERAKDADIPPRGREF